QNQVTTTGAIGIDRAVTIQGNPNGLPPSLGMVPLEVFAGTADVTLKTLSALKVTLDAGSAQTTVTDSNGVAVTEVGGGTAGGRNVISFNAGLVLGLTGNTSGTPTADQVLYNRLTAGLTLAHDDGALVKGNTFNTPGTAVTVTGGANVTVQNNTIATAG